MAAKPLPTGEEPAMGFEDLLEDLRRDLDSPYVSRVAATQLSSLEKRELDRIREDAITLFKGATGLAWVDISLEDELNLWPREKDLSDKLIYRSYHDGALRGYALVVTGWPEPTSWTVQHVIVDPSYRLKGAGMGLVQAIEDDMRKTTEGIETLQAFPFAFTDNGFWGSLGFEKGEVGKVALGGRDFPMVGYRKNIG